MNSTSAGETWLCPAFRLELLEQGGSDENRFKTSRAGEAGIQPLSFFEIKKKIRAEAAIPSEGE